MNPTSGMVDVFNLPIEPTCPSHSLGIMGSLAGKTPTKHIVQPKRTLWTSDPMGNQSSMLGAKRISHPNATGCRLYSLGSLISSSFILPSCLPRRGWAACGKVQILASQCLMGVEKASDVGLSGWVDVQMTSGWD